MEPNKKEVGAWLRSASMRHFNALAAAYETAIEECPEAQNGKAFGYVLSNAARIMAEVVAVAAWLEGENDASDHQSHDSE